MEVTKIMQLVKWTISPSKSRLWDVNISRFCFSNVFLRVYLFGSATINKKDKLSFFFFPKFCEQNCKNSM